MDDPLDLQGNYLQLLQRFNVTTTGQLEQALRKLSVNEDDTTAQAVPSQDPKWRETIKERCEGSAITSNFCNNQFIDPMNVPAMAIKQSPLDPKLPCNFCDQTNVHLEELIPESMLTGPFKE